MRFLNVPRNTRSRVYGVCPADLGGDAPGHEIEVVLKENGGQFSAEAAWASAQPASSYRCPRHPDLALRAFVPSVPDVRR